MPLKFSEWFDVMVALKGLGKQWPGVKVRLKEIAKTDPTVGAFVDTCEEVAEMVRN